MLNHLKEIRFMGLQRLLLSGFGSDEVLLFHFVPFFFCISGNQWNKKRTKQTRSREMEIKWEETKRSTFSCKHKNTFSRAVCLWRSVRRAGISNRPSSGNSLHPSRAQRQRAKSATKRRRCQFLQDRVCFQGKEFTDFCWKHVRKWRKGSI